MPITLDNTNYIDSIWICDFPENLPDQYGCQLIIQFYKNDKDDHYTASLKWKYDHGEINEYEGYDSLDKLRSVLLKSLHDKGRKPKIVELQCRGDDDTLLEKLEKSGLFNIDIVKK